MLTLMRHLSNDCPESMLLSHNADGSWSWENNLLGRCCRFVYGDESTLPCDPLSYIAGQVQEDIVLLATTSYMPTPVWSPSPRTGASGSTSA